MWTGSHQFFAVTRPVITSYSLNQFKTGSNQTSRTANYISGNNYTIYWAITFAANVLSFWVVPKAIQVWGHILEHCRCILVISRQAYLQITFPATISPSIGLLFLAADVLPFWAVPKAIRVWENFRNHFQCILDNFLANISVKYISGNNFTVYLAVVFAANVQPFWAVLKAILVWRNIWKHFQHILDNFPASIPANQSLHLNSFQNRYAAMYSNTKNAYTKPTAVI